VRATPRFSFIVLSGCEKGEEKRGRHVTTHEVT